jgi:Ca2+-binding EF-hand superfamily protein
MTERHEKQSESLEVRLGHDAKRAFMEACREKGMTASEVVRQFVTSYPVRPVRRPWARLPTQLTEYPMTMTLTAALAATLMVTAVLPVQMATADRQDPEREFARLDTDADGYFIRADLYHLAGMTHDGRLGDGLRDEAMASITEAMAEFGPAAQETLLGPDYIERVLSDAEHNARTSIDGVFDLMDDNADGRISHAEFIAHAD